LNECRRFVLSNQRPEIRGLIGLHASFTVSDETLRHAGAICRDLGTVLHIHVAEDRADVEDARRRGYAGPLERLIENDALVNGSILAHGVHLTREQVQTVAKANCWLVQNPRSNQGNGVGYPQALSASPSVALGTDGYPADMQAENQALSELSRNHGADEESAAADRLDSGRALVAEHFGGDFGPPVEGATADLIVLEKDPAAPRHVIVAGRLVVRNGSLLTGDIDAVRTEAQREAQSLWKRLS
jgi:cytosine/adenosine deaminase-related metal-dependent hydrolase